MRSVYVTVALAGTLSLATTTSARAEDGAADSRSYKGRFGLGGDRSLAGVGGVSARFWVAKNFGLQVLFALSRSSFEQVDMGPPQDVSLTETVIALRGDLRLFDSGPVDVGSIFGLDVINRGLSSDRMDDSDTALAFEAGLKVEYHVNHFFSLHGEVGAVFALADGLGRPSFGSLGPGASAEEPLRAGGSGADGDSLLLGMGDTFGSAGFTFWFK